MKALAPLVALLALLTSGSSARADLITFGFYGHGGVIDDQGFNGSAFGGGWFTFDASIGPVVADGASHYAAVTEFSMWALGTSGLASGYTRISATGFGGITVSDGGAEDGGDLYMVSGEGPGTVNGMPSDVTFLLRLFNPTGEMLSSAELPLVPPVWTPGVYWETYMQASNGARVAIEAAQLEVVVPEPSIAGLLMLLPLVTAAIHYRSDTSTARHVLARRSASA